MHKSQVDFEQKALSCCYCDYFWPIVAFAKEWSDSYITLENLVLHCKSGFSKIEDKKIQKNPLKCSPYCVFDNKINSHFPQFCNFEIYIKKKQKVYSVHRKWSSNHLGNFGCLFPLFYALNCLLYLLSKKSQTKP